MGEKLYTILSVSVLSVSVSADMKIIISVFYRYRPIKKKAYRSYTDMNIQNRTEGITSGARKCQDFGIILHEMESLIMFHKMYEHTFE